MRAGIYLAAALLFAASARAAEPKKKDEAAEKAETPRQKMEKRKGAKGGAADKAKAEAAAADAADRVTALRAKSLYMYAVEACEQPARCDAVLRDDTEQRFMDACRACAPADRCESERAAIKEGSAKRTVNPCAQ